MFFKLNKTNMKIPHLYRQKKKNNKKQQRIEKILMSMILETDAGVENMVDDDFGACINKINIDFDVLQFI